MMVMSARSSSSPSPSRLRFLPPTRASASRIWFAAMRCASLTRSFRSSTASSGAGYASSFFPIKRSIFWYSSTSYCVTSVTAKPERPARAVRPTRCT